MPSYTQYLFQPAYTVTKIGKGLKHHAKSVDRTDAWTEVCRMERYIADLHGALHDAKELIEMRGMSDSYAMDFFQKYNRLKKEKP